MACKVCNSSRRYEIENALLNMNPNDSQRSLEAIAKEFDIPENDLKVHVLFHTSLGINSTDFEETPNSIARESKIREINILEQVANEYLVTMKNVGARINSLASGRADDLSLEKFLSKAMVDLYINTGAEIRQTIKAMAEINQIVNGPQNGGVSGLAALADAIIKSKK